MDPEPLYEALTTLFDTDDLDSVSRGDFENARQAWLALDIYLRQGGTLPEAWQQ